MLECLFRIDAFFLMYELLNMQDSELTLVEVYVAADSKVGVSIASDLMIVLEYASMSTYV